MLTTIDNPYNPFEDFKNWYQYDCDYHYNTCDYIARLANIKEDFTQIEEIAEIERVCDKIISLDPFNIYIKVYNTNIEEVDLSEIEEDDADLTDY